MTWKPRHADHAIERVTVTASFVGESATVKLLSTIAAEAAAPAAEAGLTNRIEIQGIEFTVGQQGPAPKHVPVGYGYQQMHPSRGLVKEIKFERGMFVYSTVAYKSWSDFKEELSKTFFPFLLSALKTVDLREIKLEYADEFYCPRITMPKMAQLFRAGSKWVPPFVAEAEAPFHSHIGLFTKYEPADRRLINVNIATFDANAQDGRPMRVAKVLTLAADSNPEAQLSGEPADRLDGLHDAIINVFGETISEGMAQQIGMRQQ